MLLTASHWSFLGTSAPESLGEVIHEGSVGSRASWTRTPSARWIEDRGITFTVLHDRDGSIEETFQTLGVPETFVIHRQGVVVERVTGPRLWDSPDAEAFRADLLREGA